MLRLVSVSALVLGHLLGRSKRPIPSSLFGCLLELAAGDNQKKVRHSFTHFSERHLLAMGRSYPCEPYIFWAVHTERSAQHPLGKVEIERGSVVKTSSLALARGGGGKAPR